VSEPTVKIKVDISRIVAALADTGMAGVRGAEAGTAFREAFKRFGGSFCLPPSIAAMAREGDEFELAVSNIAFLAQLPQDIARRRFQSYVTSHPYDWRDAYQRVLWGADDVWAVLRGEK
jgi:hypothetical protein